MVRIKLRHLVGLLMIISVLSIILFIPSKNHFTYALQSKLFSPGKIYFKHATNLGDPIMCRECHKPGKALDNSSCTGCHTRKELYELDPHLAESHKLFAKKGQCLRCHTEHLGTYNPITDVRPSTNVHEAFPKSIDSKKCINCHRSLGEKYHGILRNKNCKECHKNGSWTSDFEHRRYLSKAKTITEMLNLCNKCHQPGQHYNSLSTPQTQGFCIYCHRYWSRRAPNKVIPFPEKLFDNLQINPSEFSLNQ